MICAVFAILDGPEVVRVTAWLPSYTEAYAEWANLDRHRLAGRLAANVRGISVASDDDAREWARMALLRPAAVTIHLPVEPAARASVDPPKPRAAGDRGDYGKVSYRKLASIEGFTRTKDEWAPTPAEWKLPSGRTQPAPQYRRMVRCDTCGTEVAALGVGYHQRNKACQAMKRAGR